jgi:AcrR family transcriptional regulator
MSPPVRVALLGFSNFERTALAACFRLAGERQPHMPVQTPEMERVFEEVRDAFSRAIEHGGAPRVDADYLAAACIGLAREVGQKMLARRPIDPAAATDFAVALILRGTAGLSEASR